MKTDANRKPAVRGTNRLSVQLIAWFLAIALVPLAIVTVSTYLAAERALRDQVTTSLYAIARRQANQIATYVREREQNVATLSRMPGTIAALEDLARVPVSRPHPAGNSTRSTALSAVPVYYQEAFGYDDLLLVVPDGRVVFSARAPDCGHQSARRSTPDHRPGRRIRSRSDSLDIDFSDFALSSAGDIEQFLAAPVFGKNTLLGVVILRLNTHEILESCPTARDSARRAKRCSTGESATRRSSWCRSAAGWIRRLPVASHSVVRSESLRNARSRALAAKAWSSIIGTGASSPSGATCRTRRRTRGEDRRQRGVRPDSPARTAGDHSGRHDRWPSWSLRPVPRAVDLRSGRDADRRHLTHR